MTAAQIARAIDYISERTETALERLEQTGQVVRDEEGRWGIGLPAIPQINGRARGARNGKLQAPEWLPPRVAINASV